MGDARRQPAPNTSTVKALRAFVGGDCLRLHHQARSPTRRSTAAHPRASAFHGQSGAPVILDNLFQVPEPRKYAAGVVTESVSYSSAHGDSAEATAAGYWAVGASLDAIGDWLRQL